MSNLTLASLFRGANRTSHLCISSYRSLYDNPFVVKFKEDEGKVSKNFYKQTTGLTGLFIDENPHHSLRAAYDRILRVLENFPADAVYRVYTEKLVNQRLALVNEEPDIMKLEEKIGMGQLEEVVEQANYEYQAAQILLEHKVWEPLAEKPAEEQWRWPIH